MASTSAVEPQEPHPFTEIEQLRARTDQARFQLAESKHKLDGLVAEVITISHEVARGLVDRAPSVPELLERQKALERAIKAQESEYTALKLELAGAEQAEQRAKLAALLEHMEGRRAHIIALARELSAEWGKLQHSDRAEGLKLIGEYASAGRRTFFELLTPVDIHSGAWADSVRIVGSEVIQIRGTTPL